MSGDLFANQYRVDEPQSKPAVRSRARLTGREAYERNVLAYQSQMWDVLRALESGPIAKVDWERTRNGARLAPHVNELIHAWGFSISGDGTPSRPYTLRGRDRDWVKVTPELQAAYYRTAHWRKLRNARLAFDDHQCVRCHGRDDLQVHHWTYDLFRERLRDLATLCSSCHAATHAQRGIRIAFPKGVDRAAAERILSEPVVDATEST